MVGQHLKTSLAHYRSESEHSFPIEVQSKPRRKIVKDLVMAGVFAVGKDSSQIKINGFDDGKEQLSSKLHNYWMRKRTLCLEL